MKRRALIHHISISVNNTRFLHSSLGVHFEIVSYFHSPTVSFTVFVLVQFLPHNVRYSGEFIWMLPMLLLVQVASSGKRAYTASPKLSK